MYQKRELATSRDLVKEFLTEFPSSPLWPEASLLAGYVELADCKFDDVAEVVRQARRAPRTRSSTRPGRDPEGSRAPQAAVRDRDHAVQGGQTDRRDGRQEGRHAGAEDGDRGRARLAPPRPEVPPPERRDHRDARAREQRADHGARVAEPRHVRSARPRSHASPRSKTLEQEQLADANSLVEDLRRLGEQITVSQVRARARQARGDGPGRCRRCGAGAARRPVREDARRARQRDGRRRQGRRRGEHAGVARPPPADPGRPRPRRAVSTAPRTRCWRSSRPRATSSRRPRSSGSTPTRAACSTRPSSARSTR